MGGLFVVALLIIICVACYMAGLRLVVLK